MLSSKRKSEIKRAVVKIMRDVSISSLPVDLSAIFDYYKWCYRGFDEAAEEGLTIDTSKDGYTLGKSKDGQWLYTVVFNHEFISQRIRWTLAHEIGHIVLGHIKSGKSGAIENEEAQYFAEQLLSPIAVVAKLGAQSGEDIMQMCNISNEATGWRIPDLQRHFWYREKYGYTEDDKAFLKQFEDFINANQK